MTTETTTRNIPQPATADLQQVISAAVVTACVNAFGGRVRGIILTGSLARGEATFVRDSGIYEALGDAEFFVVFEQRCALPAAVYTESVRQQAERTLIGQGIRCHIDLSPVHPSYLRELQPHILAYELRECGQVVWGDTGLLSLIPPFPASAILLEDAWRLLCNRMVEYLGVAADLFPLGRPMPRAAFYKTVKLYLDMATSFLLFAGEYEPTYAGRAARLRRLAAEPSCGLEPPFPLDEFAERVAFCTAFKLRRSVYREQHNEAFWRDGLTYTRGLWRWELQRLTGSAEQCSDRELMRVWMRRQNLVSRVRGWVRVVRDCGWARSWRLWPRWLLLARQASPRHWVYAAATEIVFRLPEPELLEQFDTDYVRRWLPVPLTPQPLNLPHHWAQAGFVVLSNYERFVAVTRA